MLLLVLIGLVALIAVFIFRNKNNTQANITHARKLREEHSALFEDSVRLIKGLRLFDRNRTGSYRIYPWDSYNQIKFRLRCIADDEHNGFEAIRKEENSRYEEKHPIDSMESGNTKIKNRTMWHDLSEDQFKLLYKITHFTSEHRDDLIILENDLLMSCENSNEIIIYMRALADTIHENFPDFDIDATPDAIDFQIGTGKVECKNI